jgi:hypothetical protein
MYKMYDIRHPKFVGRSTTALSTLLNYVALVPVSCTH